MEDFKRLSGLWDKRVMSWDLRSGHTHHTQVWTIKKDVLFVEYAL